MNNVQSAPNGGGVAVGVGVGIKTARSNIFNVDGLPQQMAALSIDYSSIRGKDVLVQPSDEQRELLQKRLQDRIADNCGETIYEIGVGEDGSDNGLNPEQFAASVATLHLLAANIDADVVKLRERRAEKGQSAQFLIRKHIETTDFMEIRVAVVGNVDAGKSTLLGVLTHGELDNGRGHARQRLFRHKHEIESGRTSSVGNDILGFDGVGNVVNKPDHGHLDWVKICENSAKVITFIDLAGHERYLKTTVFGMTGHAPDFGMLMIGANAGIIGMTKEHLGLALALAVPVFVVVTKIDMCPANVLQDNMKLLFKMLKSQGCRKVPVVVRTQDDVVLSATNFVSERLCPIFQVSNVTGDNLELLKMFLNLLSTRMAGSESLPAEFQIDDVYSVPGVGTVVSGTCLQGTIRLNDGLMLGPDAVGGFVPITIKSIHRKRMNVARVRCGQTASFALKKIKRAYLRKGMVMVSQDLKPQACWEFEGEILVLHHPTTISARYQAMVHCGSIRQTASIIHMSRDCLRTGDKAHVKFRFIKQPEYIRAGQRLVFREGRTKAVGNILRPLPNAAASPYRPKPAKMQSRSQNGGSNGSNNQHRHQGQGSSSSSSVGAGGSKDASEEKQNGDKREGGSRRGGKRKRNNRPTPSSNGSAGLGLPLGEMASSTSAEAGPAAGLTE
ncbi:GTP-binding protein 1 [Drosophila kikkawai]|uniref:GTP-binding protein 1 n=1 Tax=Drosophila kikkawai TaxID=30033 RepID=A0A6P4IRT8_DROKI|nr:GTP-binding protein 1 [Drosophila kikkawai]XP_017025184.1 GTP-binding protein 1 [Drosophila kikkawai]XP_017025185.1 GTP-binding protein 1 [Drosophila kikkawai]